MEKELPVEVITLKSADVVINDNIGIERKTVEDLKNSVTSRDRTLWDQVKVLKETYKHPAIIVEGYINPKEVLVGSIINSLQIGWSIPIIYTENLKSTADKIEKIWNQYGEKKYTGPPPPCVIKAKSPKEIRWAMVQCIAGIGSIKAKEILQKNPTIFSNEFQHLDLNNITLPKLSKELLFKVLQGEN